MQELYGAKYLGCKRNSIAIAGERCSMSNYRPIPVISIVACKNYMELNIYGVRGTALQ